MRLKQIKHDIAGAINSLSGIIELLIQAGIPDEPVPTIWIIGPPRSGSTLLYQVLIRRYQLAYISNFAATFFKAPILSSWAAKFLFKHQLISTEFKSYYGRTLDRLGPHEAGSFMYRWFPKGNYVYVPPNSMSQKQLRGFKKEIVGLGLVFEAPVLFKNVYNSMRIAPIIETFPNACFLVCRRDPLDIAQSILIGRMKLYNDKSKWMGVPPKEVDQIKAHPYWEQIVEQVYYTYQQIESDKRRYGADRFFDVHYESLCEKPQEVLQEMEHFFLNHSIKLKTTGEIPDQFSMSTGKRVDDDDYFLIRQVVTKLWP